MTPEKTLASFDWASIEYEIDETGCAVTPPLFDAEQCEQLTKSYDDEALFRSKVVMARHGFGRGEYKYFAYPLLT